MSEIEPLLRVHQSQRLQAEMPLSNVVEFSSTARRVPLMQDPGQVLMDNWKVMSLEQRVSMMSDKIYPDLHRAWKRGSFEKLRLLLNQLSDEELSLLVGDLKGFKPNKLGFLEFKRFMDFARGLEKLHIYTESFEPPLKPGLYRQLIQHSFDNIKDLAFFYVSVCFQDLAHILSVSPLLENLTIDGCQDLGEGDFTRVVAVPLENMRICELHHLSQTATTIVSLLKIMPSLYRFALTNLSRVKDSDFSKQEAVKLHNLKELYVANVNLNGQDLSFFLSLSPVIEMLAIDTFKAGRPGDITRLSAQQLSEIKVLSLGYFLNSEDLVFLTQHATKLEKLTFYKTAVMDKNSHSLGENVVFASLKYISIETPHMSNDFLVALLKASPHLEEFYLSSYGARISRNLSGLPENCLPELKKVELHNVDIPKGHVAEFGKAATNPALRGNFKADFTIVKESCCEIL